MSIRVYLLTVVIALLASSPLQAAAKKADAQREALVTAMQAVSPDALGGRLGLEIASRATPKSQPKAPAARPVATTTERSADLAGYQAWKRAKKS